MISPAILPVVRRAILDLLEAEGGEHNHDVLALELQAIGHRVAARDVAEQLLWLAERGLVRAEVLGPYTTARIVSDGRDVARGLTRFEGVGRHKTGE